MSLNIRIVLIQTWHPGNIGAAARAMKNMGLDQLVLVNPVDFPSDEAYNRAGKATDVLDNARIVGSLAEAIGDCNLVIGTSARERSIKLPGFTAEECGREAVQRQQQSPVAIVFGRERMGLHNDDIQQCHAQVNIDANPEYPVLNLSQAVQLICYEVFKAVSDKHAREGSTDAYPLHQDLNRFYEHLETTLEDIDFLNPDHPGQTLDHLRSLFRRAQPTSKELRLLRGVLSAAQKAAGKEDN
ncbi:RNA methyltransferase [Saccharospirillum salsuginis]|uniref:tRNA (cytidine/uridine-2'-O-)-methyltransferase TrmJ n=1 Tax=Saccharospirillum salsuginis TaxID=418750 RepID=A0A918NEL6_9GAMM|nr:RNA methyltransferase [Saccharospirillum salsuginis]GGX64668.1 tRNA (cytidine/uridine-2'-O-)-methyltransferase TrmJ [Saccharospirillum salsuginis]